jgi:hypothetical protein
MASKIGEVLEIEAADSYIKRPVGPIDYDRTKGYLQAPGVHPNSVNGGRNRDQRHDSTENFVL